MKGDKIRCINHHQKLISRKNVHKFQENQKKINRKFFIKHNKLKNTLPWPNIFTHSRSNSFAQTERVWNPLGTFVYAYKIETLLLALKLLKNSNFSRYVSDLTLIIF